MITEPEYARNYILTPKQYAALGVIANKERGFEPQSLDVILSRMTYPVTKQAFQFTLRSLIKRGLVQKLERRNDNRKSRRYLQITMLGLHKLNAYVGVTQRQADRKVCEIDEIAVTDRLLKEIADKFQEYR